MAVINQAVNSIQIASFLIRRQRTEEEVNTVIATASERNGKKSLHKKKYTYNIPVNIKSRNAV